MGTIINLEEARQIRAQAAHNKQRVVFTNGCFDFVHRGHVEYLIQAKALGQLLIVGLNSDRSVRALKGPGRPVTAEADRAYVLAALACVDYVLIFDQDTPAHIIEALVPDVLAKGGDWPVEKIVGREVVEANGGRVVSIESSVPDYSSSRLIEHVLAGQADGGPQADAPRLTPDEQAIVTSLRESAHLKQQVARTLSTRIAQVGQAVVAALQAGKKILLCGNGGSATDAQHIAAELVGRYKRERDGLAALALTTDTSILTSVSNDYQFQMVFARQVRALASAGDVLIAISTSGNSDNVVRAVEAATELELTTVGLLGKSGGTLAPMVDYALTIPATDTPRIQEAHITIGHIICECVDHAFGS